MKIHVLIATLTGFAAATLLALQPCAAQQTSYHYCPIGYYWNLTTDQCQPLPKCPEDTAWNLKFDACMPICSPECKEGCIYTPPKEGSPPIFVCKGGLKN